ncbi:MAG: UDP-N-acetylmuramate dehydrogenase [Candidatus Omnitrophica bacterium]|nr:UDP-N-acetylmuramate dehydrogenase [Candidatus Omnitrophota bacterium]MBD3269537.1 UDP-N-acetylmuramate dehydrogenase [Candidatus Omnitrophota bacterium]
MYSNQARLSNPVDLRLYTTLKIGGCAALFFIINEKDQFPAVEKYCRENFYLLGNGSNILVKDKFIKTPVIKLGRGFCYLRHNNSFLEAGASTPLSFLIKYCLDNNISLAEKLVGIPATIGGMLAMNASSFGCSLASRLQEVEVYDLRSGTQAVLKKDEIEFSYRCSSLLRSGLLILRAQFRISRGKDLKAEIEKRIKERLKKQDFSSPSCGSVFKNPAVSPAARLIEACGLKGVKKGGAQVSGKHANFIINRGGASYRDVDFLIKMIKDKVFKKYNIILKEEIQRWG